MKRLYYKIRNIFALLLVVATVSQGIIAPSTDVVTTYGESSIWMLDFL